MADIEKRRTLFGSVAARHAPSPPSQLPFSRISSSPWTDFTRIFTAQQGDSVDVVINNKTSKVMAIRKVAAQKRPNLITLRSVSHENIVSCHTAYHHDDSIFLVYENMQLPMRSITETPRGRLEICDVAYIASAVLAGIVYIHAALGITHGAITMETIMVNLRGQVKLASVAERLLIPQSTKTSTDDTHAIGVIVRDLLEPDSAIGDPDTIKLQRPLANKTGLQAFLDLTQSQSASELLQHTFLSLSKGPQSLIPYVLVANEIGLRRAEVHPLTKRLS